MVAIGKVLGELLKMLVMYSVLVVLSNKKRLFSVNKCPFGKYPLG